jgi:enoyl-CoA hydratase
VVSVLTLDIEGPVAYLTLDRPTKSNAMGNEFWRELPTSLDAVATDPKIRCLVLKANGKHFSSGLDLDEAHLGAGFRGDNRTSRAAQSNDLYHHIHFLQSGITQLSRLTVPTIAAVHGLCIGGGIDLIAACDIRLATRDAMFSIRETKIAIVADLGSLQRLPSIMPKGILYELALSGRDFSASEALAWGLLNRTTSDQESLYTTTRELAEEIARNSPLATQGTKRVLNSIYQRHEDDDLERVALWNTAFLQSEDLEEAFSAFQQRRPPEFRGI